MTNLKLITTNDEPLLKTIAIRESNLWMEPSTKKGDFDFWVKRFKDQKVPFVLMQYDTEMLNDRNEKMYRRVYGLFIDMKTWEKKNDVGQQASES